MPPSPENQEKCQPDNIVYTSNPPQYCCVKCHSFWRALDPVPNCSFSTSPQCDLCGWTRDYHVRPWWPHDFELKDVQTPPTPVEKEWEKEFEGRFVRIGLNSVVTREGKRHATQFDIDDLKSFISQVEAQAYKRGVKVERARVVEMIKSKIKPIIGNPDWVGGEKEKWEYNKILKGLITNLTQEDDTLTN